MIVRHAEEHDVDVLLVCGDIIEEARPSRLAGVISELSELLAPSIARGMECIFLAGNHDSVHTFELLQGVRQLVGGEHASRVTFVSRPTVLPLNARGKRTATLVALPYPSAGVYPVVGAPRTVEDKQAALRDAVIRTTDELCAQAVDAAPTLPMVLAGHFLLSQIQAGTGSREVAQTEDIRVDRHPLDRFAYVALGHVHQPLVLSERIRYSGALDRMDFGEADEERHVVVAEIGSGGVKLEELPLDPTPMRRFDIGAIEEMADAAEMIDDPAGTIVKLNLRLGRDDPASVWLSRARELFPRLVQPVDLQRLDDPDPPLLTGEVDWASPAETVRAFLADQLADDPDGEAVLAMAEELFEEGAETG